MPISYLRVFAGAVVLACAGAAGLCAQGTPFHCGPEAGLLPRVRDDGIAELVADWVLACTGGVAGQNLVTNFTVSFDTAVTSKTSGGASEALLLINEPDPASQVPGVNVIQGVVSAPGELTFSNVSVPQPGDATTVLRFTNLRVNASAPGSIQDDGIYAFLTNSPAFPISFSLNLLAERSPGWTSRLRTPQDAFYGGAAFSQCTPVNPGLAQSPSAAGGAVNFNVQFSERFNFAFVPRLNQVTTVPDASRTPNFPRSSETGFYNPSFPATGGLNTAGLASQGTRLRMQFAGVPAGVSLFVTVTPSPFGTSTGTGSLNQIGLAGAHLTATDQNGAGPYAPVAPTSTVTLNGAAVGIAPVTVVNGVGAAVWEILQSDPDSAEDVSFGVVVAYSGQPAPASIRMGRSLAPISADFSAGSNIVPRFIDTGEFADTLNIGACGAALPDLQVTSISASPRVDAATRIPVSGVVLNNSPTAISSPFEIAYSLFEDSGLTRPVADSVPATCALSSLAGNSSASCPASLDVPGGLTAGNYYIGALVDARGQVAESNEANNTASVPVFAAACQILPRRLSIDIGPGASTQGIAFDIRAGCPWLIVSNSLWIHILNADRFGFASGVGPATFSFKADANPGPLPRASWVQLGGFELTVNQAGAGTPSQIRVYRGGAWFADGNLDHGWNGAPIDQIFSFGVPGDIPVMGDWDGSGLKRLGIYRGGLWYVDLDNNQGWDGIAAGADAIFSFGVPGDIPVTGDWNGSGQLNIGVYRNGLWYVDMNGNNQWDGTAGGDAIFSFGVPGDIPVIGDWDGSGTLKMGIYRNGLWFVDRNGNHQWDGTAGGDAIFSFGVPGDIPVVGDWDGSGQLRIGIYRNGVWFVDMNGNHQWDGTGPGADATFSFGVAGDAPIVAR